MSNLNKTIFISIASYKDPEIIPTIIDCIKKADNYHRIFFGICLQDDTHTYKQLRSLKRKFKLNMRIAYYDWRDSQGACWARHIIQKKLYQNQDFYLQLDSHHRFREQWDSVLIHMLQQKQQEKFEKPIIGGYCPGYRASDNHCDQGIIQICSMDKFTSDGDLVFRPMVISKKETGSTIPARFLSGHFIFTIGKFCKECLYDPNLYFRGEEITLSARAFTHGYTFFHPNLEVIWHYYIREKEDKHWDNHDNNQGFVVSHSMRDKKAKARVRKLLGIENNNLNFANYGLGNTRKLHKYELYAGVNFKNKTIHKYAYNARGDAPFAYEMSENEWESMMHNKLVVVDFDKNIVNEIQTDLDNIILCLEDNKNRLLYRTDIKPLEFASILRNNLSWKKEIGIEDMPHRATAIPVYKGGRFGKKIINNQVNYYDSE